MLLRTARRMLTVDVAVGNWGREGLGSKAFPAGLGDSAQPPSLYQDKSTTEFTACLNRLACEVVASFSPARLPQATE